MSRYAMFQCDRCGAKPPRRTSTNDEVAALQSENDMLAEEKSHLKDYVAALSQQIENMKK